MVSPATNTDPKKAKSKSEKDADEAFQALLSSQRDILAQLNFGNSSSELQFTEGPDNLPIVSPHASADFHSSFNGHFETEQQQQYPSFEEEMCFPREYQQTVGVGDDRFILDHIEIGPGDDARGPAYFDAAHHRHQQQMRRRRRETEQELMGVVSQRKKRRSGSMNMMPSINPAPTFSDDMLPGPSDLADLDESSSSLLLDDLDFPSIHSHATTDAAMWKPRERTVTEDSCDDDDSEVFTAATSKDSSDRVPEIDAKPAAKTEDAMDAVDEKKEDDNAKPAPTTKDDNSGRRRPPARSQRSLWKPRARTSSSDSVTTVMSIADQRSLWKPRKRDSAVLTTSNDSCASLQVEDLELPQRSVPRTVSSSQHTIVVQGSLKDGDMDHDIDDEADSSKHGPSRTCSSDSTYSRGGTPTVKALSVALQQSIGSTKSIQEWDRKMGLKRSHSKTMRQSSKSREQLLAFLQREQEDLASTATDLEQCRQQDDMDEEEAGKPAVVEL